MTTGNPGLARRPGAAVELPRRRPRRRHRRLGRAARQPMRDLPGGGGHAARAAAAGAHLGRHPRRRRAPDPALPDAARPAAAGSRSRRRCCSPSAASLRGAWLVGAFLSLSFATLAAYASGGTALAPFLLAAPLAPVLGVAAAYGPRQDPLEALIATAPYGRTRLILLRTIGVLVSVLPVTVLLGLAVPGPPWLAAAWLGPALALVPVLLALAGFVGPRTAATVVSLVLGRRRARLDACPRARPGRSRPHSRASTSGWPWPPAPSSRSGPAPTGSRGWRCERRHEHRRADRRRQAVRPHPRPRRRRPRLRPRRHRSARPQRRRQDDAAAHRRHLDRARTAARCGCSGATRTAPTPT